MFQVGAARVVTEGTTSQAAMEEDMAVDTVVTDTTRVDTTTRAAGADTISQDMDMDTEAMATIVVMVTARVSV